MSPAPGDQGQNLEGTAGWQERGRGRRQPGRRQAEVTEREKGAQGRQGGRGRRERERQERRHVARLP